MPHTYVNKVPARIGKTKKDHKSGAWARKFENRGIRESWQQDNKSTVANFPYHVCNGKRNHHAVSKRARKTTNH